MKIDSLEFEYKDVLNISVNSWKDLLNNKLVFDENSLNVIKAIYQFEDHCANTLELQEITGIDNHGINSIIGNLGKRVKNELNLQSIILDGKEKFYPFIVIGYSTNPGFTFELRKNLRIAMKIVFSDLKVIYKHNPENNPNLLSEYDDSGFFVDFFKRISNEFWTVKESEEFTENQYIQDMSTNFKEGTQLFLKKNFNLNKIDISSHFGKGKWINNPWFGILDKNNIIEKAKYTNGFYISCKVYWEDKIPKIKLTLNQGIEKYKYSDKLDYIWKELINYINFLPDGFEIWDENNDLSLNEFVQKNYNLESLEEELFEKDLRILLSTYEHILAFYKKLIGVLEMKTSNDKQFIKMDGKTVWKVSPGNKIISDEMWQHFYKNNYIAIGFTEKTSKEDYSEYKSQKELKQDIMNNSDKDEKTQNDSQIWNFVKEMKIGDIVIINKGRSSVYGIGKIISEYIPPVKSDITFKNKLIHSRNVEWLITKEFEVSKNLFPRHTIYKISSDKWNEIVLTYLKDKPELKKEILLNIYEEYLKTFKNTPEGVIHLSRYFKESELFKSNYYKIKDSLDNNINQTNEIIDNLISPPDSLFKIYNNTRNYLIKNFELTNEKLDELALLLFDVFETFNNETNSTILNETLVNFDNNELSKGIKDGILSSSLYFLNNDYYIINKKTIESTKLLSSFMGENIIINKGLPNYLENNNKLHKLIPNLSMYLPDITSFEDFDQFSHWLYDKKLGNYTNERYIPIIIYSGEYEFKESQGLNIKEIITKKGTFKDYLSNKKLLYDTLLIENYLLSLKVKPFVIFTGNSGTGKSKLAKKFAEYLDCSYEMIAVGSNWTDNRNIVGYYNPIIDEYMKNPSYELIDNAGNMKKHPSFLILDEMNLSRVEYYFSDILSSIESEKDINLNTDNVKNEKIPKKLFLSNNLYIVGTVNIDETTHMFSPKVLDRANTIEFNTISPFEYLNNVKQSEFKGDIEYLLNPIKGRKVRDYSPSVIEEKMNSVIIDDNSLLWTKLIELLDKLYNTLKEAHFDFGFRVINEILRFIYVSWVYEGEPNTFSNWNRYFDAQIKQKLLPRLHGSQNDLDNTLKELLSICSINNFITSEEKLKEMIQVLDSQKFVSFIN